METAPTQHMTLIVLSGALLAAIVAAVIIYFVPSITGGDQTATLDAQPANFEQTTTITTTEFNTSVLSRAEYKALDASLFLRGLLPVQPPAGTGKTNIFR